MDLTLYLKAALLGIVEGLTEFLPVSSTGHLILFGDVLRFDGASAHVFDIVIQSGAIAAVLCVYRQRFWNVLLSFMEDEDSRKFIGLLLVAFLPAAFAGLLFHHEIKQYLFNPKTVAISLILGGAVMLVIDHLPLKPRVKDVDRMTFASAVKIGLFQILAMVPGVSRSGATIIGGMLSGLDKKTAAEFSFFLAVPTLLAAGLFDLWQNRGILTAGDAGLMLTGFVTSFISGILVIVIFIQLISKWGFTPFALYRIVLGTVLLLLLHS